MSEANRHKPFYTHSQAWSDEALFPLPGCNINPEAISQLHRDEPGKRRKVYLEFDPQMEEDMMTALSQAGFDMATIKHPRTACQKEVPRLALSCLITGPAQSILKLLKDNAYLLTVRVDLPEYTWLSTAQR